MHKDILTKNIAPVALAAGASITAWTAPTPQVRIGGLCLLGAAIFLAAAKNFNELAVEAKAKSSFLSGSCGLGACVFLGGPAIPNAIQASDIPTKLFFGFIALANVAPYLFANSAVTKHGIRELKEFNGGSVTNWRGIAANYTLGGMCLFSAGVSMIANDPQTGRNLMAIGICFITSGLAGFQKSDFKMSIIQIARDVKAVAKDTLFLKTTPPAP